MNKLNRKQHPRWIRRLGAAVVSLVLAISLLPVPMTAGAQENEPAEGKTELNEKFNNLMNPGVPENYSEDMINPYGYDKGVPFLLSQKDELLLYYTWDTDKNNDSTKSRRYTVWYDSYGGAGAGMNLRDSDKGPQKGGFDQFGQYETTDAFGYTQAVAFDPTGSGRKDHVAYVGYENQTDRSWNQGYVLWILDTRSGVQYGPFGISNASCSWLSGSNADLYAGSNFFNIAAGDFDGDQKDTLIVTVIDDNDSYGLSEIAFDGSGISFQKTLAADLLNPAYRANLSQMGNTNSDKGKQKLSMSLATGDFNGDGIDDLAVLSYANKGNSCTEINTKIPWLGIALGQAGDPVILDNPASGYYIRTQDGNYSSLCTGLAAGDINNDGKDEILTAGYASLAYGPLALDWQFLYSSHTVSDDGNLTNIEYQMLQGNAWSANDSGVDDNVGPKMAVTTAAIDGKANPEHIFISGNMYQCKKDTSELNTTGTTLSYFTDSDSSSHGMEVAKSYIASIAVGNFEETNEGREQIAYVAALQTRLEGHKYSFSVHMAGGSGYDTETGLSSSYYQDSGYYIYYNQPFGLDKRPNCVIVAIDRDDDGILAQYENAAYAWSDPEIMAVLQASPYFEDVEDYLYDSPDTTYNQTVTYTFEYGKSNSVSFGAGASLSLSGTIGGFDLQTGYAMDWSETFTKSLSESIVQSFSAGAYDTVVLNRTPVFLYNYKISYMENGTLKTETLQISIPKSPRYEMLSIGGYNQFTDYYNNQIKEAAEERNISQEEYEKSFLTKLADGLHLETEGDPFGYYIEGVSHDLTPAPSVYGDAIALNKVAGISSTEYSFEDAESKEKAVAHGFTFDLNVKFGFDAGFVESNAGFYISLQYMKGYSTSIGNAKGTGFSGTVMGLNGKLMKTDGLNPDAWAFNWKLAKWNSNLQNRSAEQGVYVPIIGYALSSVTAPPLPVENPEISYTQPTDSTDVIFDLSWENADTDTSLRPKAVGYRIYLYDPTDKEYRLVDTIGDTDITSYRYQAPADGRESYSFSIRAYSAASSTSASAESTGSIATFYMATVDSIIRSIEKTGSDGLTDIYSITLANGIIQTFTVTNGTGIASVTLKSSDPATGIDTYLIVFTDGSSTEFQIQNGKDGSDGKDGKDGTNGKDGKDGTNGKNGKNGTSGTNDGTSGKDGMNGTDGKDGTSGTDGKDGTDGSPAERDIGISDIRIDQEGNFIFTLTDGNTINAGKAQTEKSGDAIEASASPASVSLEEMQAQLDNLTEQLSQRKNSDLLSWIAFLLALISLLWNSADLVRELVSGKRNQKKASGK